jgi:hypothetical protein
MPDGAPGEIRNDAGLLREYPPRPLKVSVMGRCRGGSPEMIVLARYMLGLIAIAEARET